MTKRPYTLTIAGFDPCAGAGVLADIKTFEQIRTYGMAVITANTFQHETHFSSVEWIPISHIEQQIDILAQNYTFSFIKIGLVQSMKVLQHLLNYLHLKFHKPKIIWDTILKASAGFEFHTHIQPSLLEECLTKLYVITPNYLEIQQLYPQYTIEKAMLKMSQYTNVLLKGGHNPELPNTDILLTTMGKKYILKPKQVSLYPKHGSGCVLSAAITAYLTRGYPLLKAVVRAKKYTENFLSSSNTLLGLHR